MNLTPAGVGSRPTPFRARRALVVVAIATMLLPACAQRRRAPGADSWVTRVAAADADASAGCYKCLAAALEGYDVALGQRADGEVARRAYRVAVHLAIRERLIGLWPGEYQDAPAARRERAAPADVAAAEDVLETLPWRRGTVGLGAGMSVGREELPRLRSRYAALEPLAHGDAWAATLLLALVSTSPFVAMEEGQRVPPPAIAAPRPEVWQAWHPADLALAFTRLTLLRSSIEDVTAFGAAHPAFVEVAAIVGEAELARGRLVSAEEALAAALADLPGLVPALTLRGDIRQRMEDFDTALGFYDAVLARAPEHREALLGHMRCLGFMGRHEAAIADADRLLGLDSWYLGEAHYWKAWNLFNLRRLDDARASVDDARRLLVNADVHYLGGVIAFRQERQDDALRDFDAAIDLEERHCEAHFDRAALHLVRRVWDKASIGFDEAHDCHAARTPTFEQRIADAREARLADGAKVALVARRERALREHLHQRAWARYNAAVAHANIGHDAIVTARIDEALALGGPAAAAARDLLIQLRLR